MIPDTFTAPNRMHLYTDGWEEAGFVEQGETLEVADAMQDERGSCLVVRATTLDGTIGEYLLDCDEIEQPDWRDRTQ